TDALLTTTHHTLTAYLTTDRDTAPDEAELLDSVRRHLAAVLPPYMLPAQYVVLDAFPLTPNGKIDRTALPAPRPAEDTDDRGDGRPRTLREERLAAIWCALLDRQEIGVHTDFFQAGGDSLLAVRVAAAASAAGLPLTPGDLLAHPTIAGQAALLTGRGDGDGTPGASGDQGGLPEIEPDPEGRYAPFPLTDLQQAYLLGRGEGFALGGGPAVFSAEIDVADLDVERLEAAWQTMIARHAMLRTVCTGDGTRQRVLPESETPPYRIARHDLRDRPEPERERHLGAVRERLAHRVRRPDAWPLFEIATTRLDARHTRLHLAIDLLVTDGASLGRLLHEWGVRYQRPDAVPPAPPEVSFRDYVRALERLEDSPAYAQARDHWLARLPDLPEAPALPTRKAPGSVRQPRFTTRTFRLDGTAWTRLRQRALGHGLTPSMALCWAYAAVLRTWSGQDRCTLNVTV
ncbi:condensation domain-containing protein, partial [Streptomyces sp. JJ36]|uniref:condensation domain-containing protein n=1 Tax=Streptomyces sp. JJ36 TaxID=2736645 RepID=UPI001F22AE24